MTTETIESRLIGLLNRFMADALDENAIDPSSPLTALGATSVVTVSFLLAIEEEFSICWDDSLPRGTLDSIASIAAYLRTKVEDRPS